MKIIFALLLICPSLYARDWTFLLYFAADDSEIEPAARKSIKAIESLNLPKTDQVAVVATLDAAGDDPNYRYLLSQADSKPVDEKKIQEIESDFHYGEKDTGNPATLKRFLNWGIRAYPADHYVIILVGHSWGQPGLLQDFFVNGVELKKSTLIHNYELRRVFEEVIRENRRIIPNTKFDALIVDACTSGQLDVLLELENTVDYVAASSVETPHFSFPYDTVFQAFLSSKSTGKDRLESDFLKPLVANYVKSHAPGGSLVADEGMIDAVEYFALRTSHLKTVSEALKSIVDTKPSWLLQSRAVEAISDSDSNIDLLQFSQVVGRLATKKQEPKVIDAAKALFDALGNSETDPSMQLTHITHEKASGAWAHVELDRMGLSEVAACQGIKAFWGLNALKKTKALPILSNSDDEKADFSELPCPDLGEHSVPWSLGLTAIDLLFDYKLKWPSGVSAYLFEDKDKRRLSFWIPKRETLNEKLFLRLPGSMNIRVEYLKGDPVSYLKDPQKEKNALVQEQSENLLPYVIDEKFASQLYVSEGHTHGTLFKHGLGILFQKEFPEESYYTGKLPLEMLEPSPFAWTTETYEEAFEKILKEGKQGKYLRKDFPFYRLHRIQKETRWADFLEDRL